MVLFRKVLMLLRKTESVSSDTLYCSDKCYCSRHTSFGMSSGTEQLSSSSYFSRLYQSKKKVINFSILMKTIIFTLIDFEPTKNHGNFIEIQLCQYNM